MAALPFETTRSKESPRWYSSLRVRLAVAIALLVAVAGVGASWVALRLARQALVAEVTGIAMRTATHAVNELTAAPGALNAEDATARLRALDAAISEIEALALIQVSQDQAQVLATTGNPAAPESTALAARAVQEGRLLTAETEDAIRVAAPLRRPDLPAAAVVVRADLAAIIGLQQRAVRAVLSFAVLSIVVLVILMDLLAWPFVYKPIRQLRETIARVAAGDFSARVPVARKDEIGEVAVGLNEMLAQLENINESMQTRVREATHEIDQRNQELVDSYHRLFGLREQLASAEQLASVGQTAANVAHQVGTPLNLISGYVQLLKEELGSDSPHAPRLAIIEEQIGKVTSTVRTLLDRSRQVGRKSRTTAGELVTRVIEVMLPNLQAAHITHEMDLTGGSTPILVDATNLELSLLNLVTNAIDAMPDGGTLRVRVVDDPPSRVRIEIKDTGHGVPADLLPRIFDPWVSTKKPGRGTGLGLAIARDVVSAHGGSIQVASTVGAGTTFTIDLPSDAARDVGRVAS
jgi:two-component system NtrC family sensor kinase